MNTSDKLRQLRQEVQALKLAFAQSATKLTLYTKTLDFTTSENVITFNGYPTTGQERVVVTFRSNRNANTVAKLEIDGDYSVVPIVRRVPFSGGARWVVSTAPRYASGGWQATHYHFVVQSLVNGNLEAKMIWQ